MKGFELFPCHTLLAVCVVMASSVSPIISESDSFFFSDNWVLEEVADIGRRTDLNAFRANRTSIVLNSSGMPSIAFQNVETGEINYAHRNATGKWQTENVVSQGIKGGFAALTLDSNDRPVICYLNYTLVGLSCAFRDMSGWKHGTVDNSRGAGAYNSLTLDSLDRPHLVYKNEANELRYAWWNGTSWNITTVRHSIEGYPSGVSLDLDSSDSPHIAFSWTREGIWYYKWNQTHWDEEVVDPSHTTLALSLVLDSSNLPHILYLDGVRHAHKYAHYDGTFWSFSYIDPGVKERFGSLSVDSKQNPRVVYEVYEDYGDHELRYAYLDNGSWRKEIVDTEGYVGLQPSLALDSYDIPSVSYIDYTDGLLMYATKKKELKANIDVDPDTLNLRSRGKWITCYIELSDGYDPRDINVSTILLDNVLQPELNPRYGFVKSEESYIVDHDQDGIFERMVKFDRQKVVEVLSPGDSVSLTLTGQLYDGTHFEGTDTMRVISQPASIGTSLVVILGQREYAGPIEIYPKGNVVVRYSTFPV